MLDQGQITKDHFLFESYGVPLRIESNSSVLLKEAEAMVRQTLVDKFCTVESVINPHVFRLDRDGGEYILYKNGERLSNGKVKEPFLRFVDALMRITIAEYAVDCVFVHAGVVGWKGKGIVIPGNSFTGKSSLVYELVRRGAEYYSDDYAVFDKDGLVHPFPRRLSIRSRPKGNEVMETSFVTPEEIGGTSGTVPIPVGWILLTEFKDGFEWRPETLSPGKCVLEMVSHTAPIRYNPKFSLEILKKVSANAIILKSCRPDAVYFSEMFLEFVDNKAF